MLTVARKKRNEPSLTEQRAKKTLYEKYWNIIFCNVDFFYEAMMRNNI